MTRLVRIALALALVTCLAGWTEPQQLEQGPVRGIALGGDGAGRRVVAWTTKTHVKVAIAQRGAAFGTARNVALAIQDPQSLQIAVNPRGDAVIAWDEYDYPDDIRADQPCCSTVRAKLMRRNGRLSPTVTLSSPKRFGYDPRVAVGSGGRVGVLWSSAPGFLDVRFGSFKRGFGPLERLEGTGEQVGLTFDRRTARVQYRQHDGALKEIARRGLRRWSRATTLAEHVGVPATFGFDGRGREVGVWGTASAAETGVQLGTRTPPGPLHVRTLADSGVGFSGPELSVAESGAALAAWVEDKPDGSHAATVTMRGRKGGFGQKRVALASPQLYALTDVAVAPGGEAAVAMRTGSYSPGYESRVVLLGPSGRVLRADKVTSQLNASGLELVADSRGTAAAWGGGDGTGGLGLWVSRSASVRP
jgi:hypothetical protein